MSKRFNRKIEGSPEIAGLDTQQICAILMSTVKGSPELEGINPGL